MDPESELLGDEPVRLPRALRESERELLDAGEPWRPPRWLVVVAVLAVLVSLAAVPAWYADGRARAHETAALDTCRRALRSAAVSSDLEMTMVADNLRPSLASSGSRKQKGVLRLMSNPARDVLPALVGADELCRAVSIRPWHLSLRARRDAATTYASALVARLREVAADGRAYFRDARSLRRLRRAADLGVLGGRW
jgi:hypothetical protein